MRYWLNMPVAHFFWLKTGLLPNTDSPPCPAGVRCPEYGTMNPDNTTNAPMFR